MSPLLEDTSPEKVLTHAEKEAIITERYTFLLKTGLWPREMHPALWLQNFQGEEEQEVAYDLLKNFMYFPKEMTRELLRSAIRRIMPHVLDFTGSAEEAKVRWASITRRMLILPVQDETPTSADSGYGYTRLARDTFDLLDRQVPTDFLKVLLNCLRSHEDGLPNVVVFVDDFVGSGEQFIKTWHRDYSPQEYDFSCHAVATHEKTKFFYCPLIATSYGLKRIQDSCGPRVTLCPAHVLPPEASVLHPKSRVWSNETLQAKGPLILERIAARVLMPDTGGQRTKDWKGFHALGLNLVLDDSMPDACLGVFRFKKNRWRPLYDKAG